MNVIDIIKSKIKLSDVVGQRVKLTKRGNSVIGLCPFHGEKTPSFTVNDEKGLYYCFGCGANGDVIQFTSDINALDFKGAINYLAEIYGIDLPQSTNNKTSITPILDAATLWFEEQLRNNHVAIEYIRSRKISNDTVKKFRIGYAPTYGLGKYLLSLGFNIDDIKNTGLLNSQNQDYFYNRVIFPICNSSGNIIGFGGRSIISTQNPKYLNSKGSAFFQKRENLYASHFAVREAKKQGKIIVVEGYMDVLMLHQMGISNVVGLLGTSMTSEHVMCLWEITSEIIVWMDGDIAGKMASIKSASLALSLIRPGCIIKFVDVFTGKDPYDICINDGVDSVIALLDSAKLLSEFIWDYELARVNVNKNSIMPEQCVMLEARIKHYLSQISDNNVVKYYKKYFYSQIRNLQYSKDKSKFLSTDNPVSKVDNRLKYVSDEFFLEEYNQLRVVYVIMEFPELLDDPIIFDQFSKFNISDKNIYVLQQNIINIKVTLCNHVISKEVLLSELKKNNLDEIVNFVIKRMSTSNFMVLQDREYSVDVSKKEIEKIMLLDHLQCIQKEILDLRLKGQRDLAERLSNQAQEIDNRLRELWNY
ncbi:DNA primase [Ehrlichia chaffeensis str. Heartland]|uniref:DNA primase n=1 Tax=Ehrlichia chaffeensis TaxID=945 RepID=UPI000444ECC8|nr:DNA primase [Ehrlichia chaffeensis]AHX03821.1 DNA primase [Ehrlichia chaffeensis str. Heartland]AHX10382.1 DNA primase [Ehrlichia chaffeensis str. West Paces]